MRVTSILKKHKEVSYTLVALLLTITSAIISTTLPYIVGGLLTVSAILLFLSLRTYYIEYKLQSRKFIEPSTLVTNEHEIDKKYPAIVIAKVLNNYTGVVTFYIYRTRTAITIPAIMRFGDGKSGRIDPKDGRLVKITHRYKHRGNYIAHLIYKSPYTQDWVSPEVELIKIRNYTVKKRKTTPPPVTANTKPEVLVKENSPPSVGIDIE